MFDELILNTTDKKLLYDIRELLIEQNELLRSFRPELPKTENNVSTGNLDTLKRGDLIALVKDLPDKPSTWTRLSNEELKTLIKDGEKK